MIDQIFGLLLIGLGLQTPKFPPGMVKGDTTETTPAVEEPSKTPRRADFQDNRKEKQPMPSFEVAEKDLRGVMRPNDKKPEGTGTRSGQPRLNDLRREEFAKMGSPAGMEKFREELKAKRADAI